MDDRRLQELLAKVDRYYGSLNPDQLASQVEETQQVYDQYFGVHPAYDTWFEIGSSFRIESSFNNSVDAYMFADGEMMFGEANILTRFEVPYQVKQPTRQPEQVVVTYSEGIRAS